MHAPIKAKKRRFIGLYCLIGFIWSLIMVNAYSAFHGKINWFLVGLLLVNLFQLSWVLSWLQSQKIEQPFQRQIDNLIRRVEVLDASGLSLSAAQVYTQQHDVDIRQLLADVALLNRANKPIEAGPMSCASCSRPAASGDYLCDQCRITLDTGVLE